MVKAYIHSVKSEEGHVERAKHGFILTVGTPVNGASIANVGLLLKDILGMPDPLLSSLQKDNTFLRMMNLWARQEDLKATKFRCRPVHLYAGIESKPLGPIQVVDVASAQGALPSFAISKVFPLNHSEIAKPRSSADEPFVWFKAIAEEEVRRINDWGLGRKRERLFPKDNSWRDPNNLPVWHRIRGQGIQTCSTHDLLRGDLRQTCGDHPRRVP